MADPEHPSDQAPDHKQHVEHGKSAQQQLMAALTATDVTIRRIDRLLSTASGQERALATINYVTSILHHVSASAPWIAVQIRLGILARVRGRHLGPPRVKSPTSAAATSRWAALSSLASETRYNLRLFGLLQLWIWGSETLKSPPADPVLRALAVLQVISNVIYQLLENVAYLASKGVVSKRFVEKYGGIDKWYIWSTRGWFGHIFFQFFVLWRQHVLRRERVAEARAAAGRVESKTTTKAEDSEELRLEIRAWRKSLVNNTVWAPLCFHWCLEKGIGIPAYMTGLISFLAGAWSLHDMWAATANP
ncbi:hypothetical protein NUU61_004402 [Penicillium alfredii]|uniref:Uncharacterized protein n=1 Tax=Penicillium alfredii TaxID=1506179 RepID=A0A9W9KD78_9EURO|nr:uncharacterized protein NUU61_004402 [Penicillium alfredii]KAJ5102180.1 hypothetical protein NUU61_004402 [Penicillium alfredii]